MIDDIHGRFAMRLSLAIGLLMSVGFVQAADGQYTIARWGNALLVTAPGGSGMTPEITARLNQRVTCDFRAASLTEVVDFLRTTTSLNIVVTSAVTLANPAVTLTANDMTVANALRWLSKTSNTHVGYLNGALFISDQPVKDASITRLYDISSMTMPIRDFPGRELAFTTESQGGAGHTLFTSVNDNTTAPTTDEIEELIKQVIAQGKWSE
jgi:hypothetical protein